MNTYLTFERVLNEAESSALGENNERNLLAVEDAQDFIDELPLLKKHLKYLINHARFSRSETGVSEPTLEDACVVAENFLNKI